MFKTQNTKVGRRGPTYLTFQLFIYESPKIQYHYSFMRSRDTSTTWPVYHDNGLEG